MGRRCELWALLLTGAAAVLGGCRSDEPTSLLLSEEELATEPTLRIGDPAPPLVVREWLRGGPVQRFEDGKVYVIDFWAAWCGPCLAIMPELGELQSRHADDGVVVIAMSAVDGMNHRGDVVRAVAAYAKEPRVAVAIDGGPEGNSTVQAYMHASRESGIPRTYIVDQRGRLAWIGHAEDAGDVVASLLAGAWDMDGARAERDRETRERTTSRRLIDDWSDARDRGDRDEELRIVQELTAMRPQNVAMSPSFWFQGEKIRLLREAGDGAGARGAFMQGVAEVEFAEEPWALANFCKAMENLDPALTDPIAVRAEELADMRDARKPTATWDAFIASAERPWDTQARQVLSEYWFARGDRDRALRLIEKAIADTDRDYPGAVKMREQIRRRYETAPG